MYFLNTTMSIASFQFLFSFFLRPANDFSGRTYPINVFFLVCYPFIIGPTPRFFPLVQPLIASSENPFSALTMPYGFELLSEKPGFTLPDNSVPPPPP